MSAEKLHPTSSKEHLNNVAETAAEAEKRLLELREQYEKTGERSTADLNEIETLTKQAEALASDNAESNSQLESSPHLHMSAQKDQAYAESLSSARKGLSSYEKTVSKVIHKPQVEKISELANKTIMRPSIFTGAMTLMAVGTISLYIMSRYYGYSINSTWSLVFLAAGAVIGFVLEIIIRLIFRKNTRS